MTRELVMVASYAALVGALAVAAAVDLSCRIVPNGCAVTVAASGVAVALVGGSPADAGGGPAPVSGTELGGVCLAVGGGAAALAVMLAAACLSARARGSPGVGGGDVKLLAAAGTWLGPMGALVAIALSCLVAVVGWAAACAFDALRGRRGARPHEVAMAPAIGVGVLATVALLVATGF